LGATDPDLAIWPRLSMYCRLSRNARMSHGLCSISNTTPSYLAVVMAIAVSGSAWQNDVNAGLPDSSALMTPLRRGMSGIGFPLTLFVSAFYRRPFSLRHHRAAAKRRVPVIPARDAPCPPKRDRRDKPGDDDWVFDNRKPRFVASASTGASAHQHQ